MDQFNPRMLVIAREARCFGQAELAKRLGISQGALSKIEGGVSKPTAEVLDNFCKELDFPTGFFQQSGGVHGTGTEAFHQMYRRRQALPAKDFRRVEAQINIVRMHLEKMLSAVDWHPGIEIPKWNIEDFGGSAERTATALRASWNMPAGPVGNVTQLIEDAGGIIIMFDFGTKLVDATSFRYPGLPPLFFVNKGLTGDRMRFTLAHELAHMVLHSDIPVQTMETEADQFAAEFLMPARDISQSLNRFELRRAALLKPFWKVSMGSLLFRAKTLEKITDNQSRHLWIKMSAAGWRTREPEELDIQIEQPRFHQQLVDLHLKTMGYSPAEFAQMLFSNANDATTYHDHGEQPYQVFRLVSKGFSIVQ